MPDRMNSSFAPPPPSKSLTAAMPFALNLYLRLGHHLLSAIFSRTGPLLTMVINYVQASSALSMLKATRRDLTILLLYVFSKVYMTHHCNSGVILQKWRLINYQLSSSSKQQLKMTTSTITSSTLSLFQLKVLYFSISLLVPGIHLSKVKSVLNTENAQI